MQFVRWLVSSILGFFVGSLIIGAVVLAFVAGPILAILAGGVICILIAIVLIKEYLDDAAKQREREKTRKNLRRPQG